MDSCLDLGEYGMDKCLMFLQLFELSYSGVDQYDPWSHSGSWSVFCSVVASD